jgi:hypothetical protein
MYADVLVKDKDDNIEAMAYNQTLSTKDMYNDMFRTLKNSHRNLCVARRPLTRDSLGDAITTLYPQILIINCHGMTTKNGYYLCFEKAEKPFLLDKYTTEDMSKLWKGL